MPLRLFDAARPLAAVVTVAVAAAAAPTALAAFTVGNPGQNWPDNPVFGQSFSAATEPSADPGLAPGSTVYLTGFTVLGDGSTRSPDVDTYLVILDGAYPDTNGPANDETVTTTSPVVVGISSNAALLDGVGWTNPFAFTFDDLPLVYDWYYMAAFATIENDVLTFVGAGVLIADYVEGPPGAWTPTPNYGGAGNFDATTFWGHNANGDGLFNPFNDTADLSFTATFEVPEPAAATLFAAVLLPMLRRRPRAA